MARRKTQGLVLAAAGLSLVAPPADAGVSPAAPCQSVGADDPTGLYDPDRHNIRGEVSCAPVLLRTILGDKADEVRDVVMTATIQVDSPTYGNNTVATVSQPVDGEFAYVPPTVVKYRATNKDSAFVCAAITWVDVQGVPGIWIFDNTPETPEDVECILAILAGC